MFHFWLFRNLSYIPHTEKLLLTLLPRFTPHILTRHLKGWGRASFLLGCVRAKARKQCMLGCAVSKYTPLVQGIKIKCKRYKKTSWGQNYTGKIFARNGNVCAESLSHVQFCDPMDCRLPGSSVYGVSHKQPTGVGCHFLLQGIFPTQGSNMHPLCPCIADRFFTSEKVTECQFSFWLPIWKKFIYYSYRQEEDQH